MEHREATSRREGDRERDAFSAECFLTSANALSEDGRIVNIDGTGNRVGASEGRRRDGCRAVSPRHAVREDREVHGVPRRRLRVLRDHDPSREATRNGDDGRPR
ncbi:MAG: LUD domain-containing protein [Spirochaetota bacterium]